MTKHRDPEFPPLFVAGFTDLSLHDFVAEFVTPFPASRTRRDLVDRFHAFHARVESWRTSITLWIDGSFVTKKVDPRDIDVVALVSQQTANLMDLRHQKDLRSLIDNKNETKIRYGCDFYAMNPDDFNISAYWKGLFGFDRNDNPKGIVRLKINTP